ncbi:MAG: hypothetical protein ACKVWV_07175 [Planctomycetota bacterium]
MAKDAVEREQARSAAVRELRERRLALPDAVETYTSLTAAATAVGAAPTRMGARALPVPGERGLFDVALNNTGTGWQERFLLFIPDLPAGVRAPAVVVFHKFGVSHWDAYYNTTFLTEARNRGWFMIAPLGASGVNFGSLESQVNTRAVLDLVTSIYPVDKNRVYGVGFSMGGGGVAAYAQRNLDPNRVMFAAICDHSGGVSLSHTYFNETDDNDADDNIPVFGANLEVPDILDYWFEGPPWVYSFNYQRCQSIEINPFTGLIVPGTDMARNLKHIPTLVWLANDDPFALMVEQTMTFFGHIQTLNPANILTLAPSTFHTWLSLNESLVCDYFAQFTLQLPTSGSVLADENGVFLRFQIQQDAAFHLTPFTWSVNTVQNQLNINQTQNLSRISVNATELGLQYSQSLKINVFTSDGTGDEILLREVPAAPNTVLRDGQPASSTYDVESRTLLIQETDANPHQWIVVP